MEPLTVEGGKATLELRTDGILNLKWVTGARLEAEDAHAAMRAVNELCGDTEHPMLVDMATTESVSRGARAVFSIPCAANRIALLGKSAVDRVIANFFLGVHTPPCPTRFFTSRPEALKWLMQDLNAVPDQSSR
jgi:hypothetical protein